MAPAIRTEEAANYALIVAGALQNDAAICTSEGHFGRPAFPTEMAKIEFA